MVLTSGVDSFRGTDEAVFSELSFTIHKQHGSVAGMVGVNQFCTPAVASPWVGAASMIPTPLPQPQPAESVKSAIASVLREPKVRFAGSSIVCRS